MVSPVDKRALSPGEFTVAQNVRGQRRVLSVRGPILQKSATGLVLGTLVGSDVVTLGGVEYQAVAIRHTPANIVTSLVNPGTEVVTASAAHLRSAGQAIVPLTSVNGLTAGTTYYIFPTGATTFTIHASQADTLTGINAFNLTGSTNLTFTSPTETRVYLDIALSGGALIKTGTAFDEITSTLGTDDNTRFLDAGNVTFSVVREPDDVKLYALQEGLGTDLLVFSNGAETRVFNHLDYLANTGSSAYACYKHRKTWHAGMGTVKQAAFFPDWLDLSAANTVSITGSDGDVTGAISTAHPTTGGLGYLLTFSTAVDNTDNIIVRLTTGDTICSGKDVVMTYETTAFPEIWRSLKVEVSNDGVTYFVLYDPTVTDDPPVEDATTSCKQVAFRVDSSVISTSLVVKYLRFTWVRTHTPAADCLFYLKTVMGGGKMSGGWSIDQSNWNQRSKAESIGVTAENQYGRSTGLMGVQDQRNAVEVIVVPTMCYAYAIEAEAPPQSELNQGLSYSLYYGTTDPGVTPRFLGSAVLSAFTTGATYSYVATYTPGNRYSVTINTPAIVSAREAPDGLNECAPAAGALCSSSGRLWAGAFKSANSSGTVQGSDILVSEQDYPFRFRGIVAEGPDGNISETSGSRLVFHGETVRQIVSMSGDSLGGESVIAITDKSAWVMAGRNTTSLNRPRRVCKHGTNSPWSVVTNRNEIYWLDQEKQFRRMNGDYSVDSLSKNRYDNIFDNIPDDYLYRVCAGVKRDVIHIGYTLSGGVNNVTIAIYDTVEDIWQRDATLADTTFGMIYPYLDELRCWTQDGYLQELDAATGTVDVGTASVTAAIRPFIETGEFAPSFHEKAQYFTPWVYCQSDAGNSLTISITGRQKGLTSSGTVTLTSSDPMVKRSPPQTVGVEDNSAYMTISSTGVTARKKISGFGFHVTPIPGETLERVE